MEETWKDIEGYEGLYQVSSLGRVKSSKGNEKNLEANNRAKRILCSNAL